MVKTIFNLFPSIVPFWLPPWKHQKTSQQVSWTSNWLHAILTSLLRDLNKFHIWINSKTFLAYFEHNSVEEYLPQRWQNSGGFIVKVILSLYGWVYVTAGEKPVINEDQMHLNWK